MSVSEEYRNNARQCFTLAHETCSPESYVHWLDTACLWFDLARHSEEHEMISDSALLHDTGSNIGCAGELA